MARLFPLIFQKSVPIGSKCEFFDDKEMTPEMVGQRQLLGVS